MVWSWAVALCFEHGLAIEGALQDGFQTLIGIDLQQQGPLAGRFQAGCGIGFGKAENSEAGAIARFRM